MEHEDVGIRKQTKLLGEREKGKKEGQIRICLGEDH